MSANPHLPAGPYQMLVTATINEHQGSRHVYVIDGSGRKIASIWGKQDEKLAIADLLIGAREAVAPKIDGLAIKIRDAMLTEMRRQVAENDAPNEDWWLEVDGWRVDIGGAFDLDKVAAAVEAVVK